MSWADKKAAQELNNLDRNGFAEWIWTVVQAFCISRGRGTSTAVYTIIVNSESVSDGLLHIYEKCVSAESKPAFLCAIDDLILGKNTGKEAESISLQEVVYLSEDIKRYAAHL